MDTNKKNTWNIDVAVLLIFFTRVEKTAEVFTEIKKARPKKLFLYQDGPRLGRQDDIQNIMKCREIVNDIDWECEIHQLFQEKNYGCDPSEYIAQKWMFNHVDKGIILEDDDVPSQSFFPYCKELLDKYENDTRIGIICGMNNIGEFNNGYSYLFTQQGSIWGWATWKRVIDLWDPHYTWMADKHLVNILKLKYGGFENWYNVCTRHRDSGREHYESILGSCMRCNNLLNIVPTKNMIKNIGVGEETTHNVGSVNLLPKAVRKLLYMKRFELDFPLVHPPYVVEDCLFNKEFNRKVWGNKFSKFSRRLEAILYRIFPVLGK